MPDRQLARERAQIVFGEHLVDQAELAARDDVPAAIGRRDPSRLLPAVLQRIQGEERQPRDLVARCVYAKHTALVARSVAVLQLGRRGAGGPRAGGPF